MGLGNFKFAGVEIQTGDSYHLKGTLDHIDKGLAKRDLGCVESLTRSRSLCGAGQRTSDRTEHPADSAPAIIIEV